MNPPHGPRGPLRGGALLSFPRHPEAFLRVSRKYGDLASFRVGNQQFVVINHPDLVREVFVTKQDSFVKGWGPVAGNTVMGHGLLTSEGALHRRQRRIVLPALHRQRLEEYANAVVRHARQLVDGWRDAPSSNILADARRITMLVIAETLLGTDIAPADAARVSHALDIIFRRFAGRMHAFAGPLRRLRVRSAKIGAEAGRELRALATSLMDARREQRGDDLVSLLLDTRDDAGDPLPDALIVDEIVTMFVTGHETIALALTWAWLRLARDARAQAQLDAELDAVLGGREPSFDDLRQMPYAQGVIAESLRLHPPQWMLGRRATEPVSVGGVDLPAGVNVLLSLYTLHRDARWFDDAEAFRPERWAAGVEKSAAPFTYLPFGLSIRRCVGEGFAWMETTLLLALTASRLRALPLPPGELGMEPLIVLRPEAKARMAFVARAPEAASAQSSAP
ncbi:MAG: cytochrome P450 [Acidobacteria bacterium]|nr:cytochrome P450 [Acidobacteriota bacterium]MBV9477160.1 cytochrome P450 [Acidobacteriota bacterium]